MKWNDEKSTENKKRKRNERWGKKLKGRSIPGPRTWVWAAGSRSSLQMYSVVQQQPIYTVLLWCPVRCEEPRIPNSLLQLAFRQAPSNMRFKSCLAKIVCSDWTGVVRSSSSTRRSEVQDVRWTSRQHCSSTFEIRLLMTRVNYPFVAPNVQGPAHVLVPHDVCRVGMRQRRFIQTTRDERKWLEQDAVECSQRPRLHATHQRARPDNTWPVRQQEQDYPSWPMYIFYSWFGKKNIYIYTSPSQNNFTI